MKCYLLALATVMLKNTYKVLASMLSGRENVVCTPNSTLLVGPKAILNNSTSTCLMW